MSCTEKESGSYRLNRAGVKLFKDMILQDNKIEIEQGQLLSNALIQAVNTAPIQVRRELSKIKDILVHMAASMLESIRESQRGSITPEHAESFKKTMTLIEDAIKRKQIDFKKMVSYEIDEKVRDICEESLNRLGYMDCKSVKSFFAKQQYTLTSSDSNVIGVLGMRLHEASQSAPHKMKQITAKELTPFKAKCTDKTLHFGDHTTLNVDDQMLYWSVGEGNHAVDCARESAEGKVFFNTLSRVEWGRNTGGYIRYINEYMNENGPSEPSRVDYKGPLGDKEREYYSGFVRGR